MKAYLRKTALALVPIALVLMAVNFFGDAANIFTCIEQDMAMYMVSGKHVANAYNYDERILQRRLIQQETERHEVVVMGSSRVMLFHSGLFGTNSFRNYGVGAATLEDVAGIFQLLRNAGRLPKRIVLGLDPWILNDRNELTKWQEFSEEYAQFMQQAAPWRPLPFVRKALGQLFSPSYFQQSLPMLFKRLAHPETTIIKPIESLEQDGTSFVRLADGSIRYQQDMTSATAEQVDERARQALGGIVGVEHYEEVSEQKKALFERLLCRWSELGIDVELVLIPFHPIVYEDFRQKARYTSVLEFEAYVANLAVTRKIPFRGSLNPALLGLDRRHFYDSMHLNPEGVLLLLGRQGP